MSFHWKERKEVQKEGRGKEAKRDMEGGWGKCGQEETLASTKKEASDTLFLSVFSCLFASISLETNIL